MGDPVEVLAMSISTSPARMRSSTKGVPLKVATFTASPRPAIAIAGVTKLDMLS